MVNRFPSRNIIDNGRDVLLSHFSACSCHAAHGWWLDLSGEDLSQRDFRGWSFVRTNFDGADIAKADFSMASFSCCSFFKTNLEECNFQNAHLSNKTRLERQLPIGNLMLASNLTKCNFRAANLTGTYLAGSDLSGANLSGANLSGVRFGITLKETTDLEKLINAMLRHPDNIFQSADFESDLMRDQRLFDKESALAFLARKTEESRRLLNDIVIPSSYNDDHKETNLIAVKFGPRPEHGVCHE
jgi:uncharacterized protein YjbI with pentapeptide repeats